MVGKVRTTLQTLEVLRVLLVQPERENYGLRISQRCGLPTGSIYPILARLEAADWIASEWEDIDESVEGRRRRRLYRLTDGGAANARTAIMEAQNKLGARQGDWQPDPGMVWGV
ncbi:PadR family transcriptional regulator [Nocardia sp. NPDC004722]